MHGKKIFGGGQFLATPIIISMQLIYFTQEIGIGFRGANINPIPQALGVHNYCTALMQAMQGLSISEG